MHNITADAIIWTLSCQRSNPHPLLFTGGCEEQHRCLLLQRTHPSQHILCWGWKNGYDFYLQFCLKYTLDGYLHDTLKYFCMYQPSNKVKCLPVLKSTDTIHITFVCFSPSPERQVFLATWKDIPNENELQYQIKECHLNAGLWMKLPSCSFQTD